MLCGLPCAVVPYFSMTLVQNIHCSLLQHQYKHYRIVGAVYPSNVLIILLKKNLDSSPRIIVLLFLVKLCVLVVVIFKLERNPLNSLERQNNFCFSFSSSQPNDYSCPD